MSLEPYEVFINEKLLTCAPRSGRSRQQIISFVRGLANNPFTEGDFRDKDLAGNPLEIKIIGRFAVSYHVDHPVKEVKIVNIQPADEV